MPVISAITAAVGAVVGAVGAAGGIGAALAGSTFLSGVGGFVLKTAVGFALNYAASEFLAPKSSIPQALSRGQQIQTGATVARSFIVGRAPTRGSDVWRNEWGSNGDVPNALFTRVYALSDLPVKGLDAILFNGEAFVPAGANHADGRGQAFIHDHKGRPVAWAKFYDGTQTSVDGFLNGVAASVDRPWGTGRVYTSGAYAIVTTLVSEKTWAGAFPEFDFVVDGIRLYDPSRDSSIGGVGSQRFDDPDTWGGDGDYYPAVQALNLLLGLERDGAWFYGLRNSDLASFPIAHWIGEIERCRAEVTQASGPVAQWRSGGEIPVNLDLGDALTAIGATCMARPAHIAGQWYFFVGGERDAVASIDAGEIDVSARQTYTPFAGIDDTVNSVVGVFRDAADGWRVTTTAPHTSADHLAEDGNLPRESRVEYSFVSDAEQVQRLNQAGLAEARRAGGRRWTFRLPPKYSGLIPGQMVTFTDAEFDIDDKVLRVDGLLDLPDGDVEVDLTEYDPNDWSWSTGTDYIPGTPGRSGVIDPPSHVFTTAGFEAWAIRDDAGNAVVPAIRAFWPILTGMDWIEVQIRVKATGQMVKTRPIVPLQDAVAEALLTLTVGGIPLTVGGSPLQIRVLTDASDGFEIYSENIRYATTYECRMRGGSRSGRILFQWTDWEDGEVTTDDIRIAEVDFREDLRDRINAMETSALTALSQVNTALADAAYARARVNTLSGDVTEELEELRDQIDALIDGGELVEFRDLSIAGLRDGSWLADPKFFNWTGGDLDNWTTTGIVAHGAQDKPNGLYKSSLYIDVASGNGDGITLRATKAFAGEMPGADPAAQYVTVAMAIEINAGDLNDARLRVEWRNGGGAWTRGHAFGGNNALGRLSDWGFRVEAGVVQSKSFTFERPITADDVALYFVAKLTSTDDAVQMRVHALTMQAATQAEIDAHLAGAQAEILVDELRVEITGPTGALYLATESITTAYEAAVAGVSESVVEVADDVSALTARVAVTEAGWNPFNLIRGAALLGGVSGPGVAPAWFSNMPPAWEVVARDPASGSAAVAAAPAAHIFKAPADSVNRAVVAATFDVKPGELYLPEFRYAAGGTGPNVTIEAVFDIYNAAGASAGASIVRAVTTTSTAWGLSAFDRVKIPAGVARARVRQRVLGGGSGVAYFGALACFRQDAAALARIEQVEITTADNSGSIASLSAELTAQYTSLDGSLTAALARLTTVETVAASNTAAIVSSETTLRAEFEAADGTITSAVAGIDIRVAATENFAASTIAFRVGESGLYLTDSDGVGTFYADAQYFIASGTIAAEQLVIGDLGSNIIPDDQIQSNRTWGTPDQPFTLNPNSSRPEKKSQGELRYTAANATGAGWVQVTGGVFPVTPGEWLVISCSIDRITGTTMRTVPQIRFGAGGTSNTIVGSPVNVSNDGEIIDTTNAALLPQERRIQVPAGAHVAQMRWTVDQDNTDGDIRFLDPEGIRQRPGATHILPNSISTDLIAADFVITNSAWIGEATIGTLKVIDGAISEIGAANRTTPLTASVDGTWYTIASVTVEKYDNRLVFLHTYAVLDQEARHIFTNGGTDFEFAGQNYFRIRRGGSTICSAPAPIPFFMDTSSASGSVTYELQFKAEPQNLTDPAYVYDSRIQPAILAVGGIGTQMLKK